jgi:hypothetical protein
MLEQKYKTKGGRIHFEDEFHVKYWWTRLIS